MAGNIFLKKYAQQKWSGQRVCHEKITDKMAVLQRFKGDE